MAVKSIQVVQILVSFMVVMTVWLASMSSVDCGGKGKGGSDIILYNNNLVIRGEGGKGNGKGKGGGSLILANSHQGHHGHEEHHGGDYGGEHHGMDEKFLMNVIGGGQARSSNSGGRSRSVGRSTSKPRSANSNTWENLLMGGRGSLGR